MAFDNEAMIADFSARIVSARRQATGALKQRQVEDTTRYVAAGFVTIVRHIRRELEAYDERVSRLESMLTEAEDTIREVREILIEQQENER